MELNKNSKWINFYLRFNNLRPTNFCDYFWGSIKAILMSSVISFFIIYILISLISPIILFWYEPERGIFLDFTVFFGIMAWFGLIIGIILYKIIKYYENKPYKFKPKRNSLIKQWYLDFKNKHCTLITWK